VAEEIASNSQHVEGPSSSMQVDDPKSKHVEEGDVELTEAVEKPTSRIEKEDVACQVTFETTSILLIY
jgi:hypothetical protein